MKKDIRPEKINMQTRPEWETRVMSFQILKKNTYSRTLSQILNEHPLLARTLWFIICFSIWKTENQRLIWIQKRKEFQYTPSTSRDRMWKMRNIISIVVAVVVIYATSNDDNYEFLLFFFSFFSLLIHE